MRQAFVLSLLTLTTACGEVVLDDSDRLPNGDVDESDGVDASPADDAAPEGSAPELRLPGFEAPFGPMFSMQGLVTREADVQPIDVAQEVGIVWLNLLDDSSTVVVEATTFETVGAAFPADFELSILTPPSEAVRGTALVSYDELGSHEQPIDRSRVAAGIVVVGPAGSLASLPTTAPLTEFLLGDGGQGTVLGNFTYVSPYIVRYAHGASAEGITVYDINGVASTLQDFTVYDIRAWARSVDYDLCRDTELGKGWSTPEVNACIDLGGDPNQCLYVWIEGRAAEVEAACGEQPPPDARMPIELPPASLIELPLGIDDVRNAFSNGGYLFFLG
jgi:hypothetical protein